MLTEKKLEKQIWATIPAGPLKIIYKDIQGLSTIFVKCKGVYYSALLIEIDGESTVSFRRVENRDNVLCICTTGEIRILE
jgi:hypothetical protein